MDKKEERYSEFCAKLALNRTKSSIKSFSQKIIENFDLMFDFNITLHKIYIYIYIYMYIYI